ncbi:MAG: tRNA (adenosine(37)-N6)-threonylcarbamoyltransferase complex transferase subunit TsaD [Calditrichaeota bacterium]|nr:MAG: tRNA (adenosine(37)-N6)-threonylcarbamoyltransferase complex transferase subunit TsaD [Calditrichota bacterium]
MKLLGIETSCDETAAAVWVDDHLASNVIASQDVHKEWGGVVPELASRQHVKLIVPVVEAALSEAGVGKQQLDGIAVTYGPGLAGALLVGLNFAKALALGLDLPFVGVNHLEGHLFSNSVLDAGPEPPFLALIISGGHTELVLVREWGRYEVLGKTRDDAAGEAFDKVAQMLELPYPGGPAIDQLAKNANPTLTFPRAVVKNEALAFSYSGLKTAVLYHLKSISPAEREKEKANIAASFQSAAIEVLVEKSLAALAEHRVAQLAIAGGVARNSLLRQRLQEESERLGFRLFIPPPQLCTDNAAMIVRAGKFYLEGGRPSDFSLSPQPSLSL